MTILRVKLDTKTVTEFTTNKTVKELLETLSNYPIIAYVERPHNWADLVLVTVENENELTKITNEVR